MKTRHMPNEDPRERMKELKTKNNQMKTCTAKINRGIYNGHDWPAIAKYISKI